MSAELFDAVSAMTLAGSFAIVCVLALRAPIRRGFGARVAYAAWATVPVVALAMLLPAPVQPAVGVLRLVRVVAEYRPVVAAMPVAPDWRSPLLSVWIAGVAAMTTWLMLQQKHYLRRLGRLHARDDDAVAGIVRAEAVEGCPALVGAWRPRIVLPADFDTRYAPVERELILAHEQMHRVRGDAHFNLVAAALRCLNWFNPLVHYAVARFRFDQELACDAAVIARFPHARRAYADAMWKTQSASRSRPTSRLAVGCRWPAGHPLKERIAMLKQPPPTHARRAIGIALVALFGLGSAYVAWAAQSTRPHPVAAAPGTQIDAQLRISVDGGAGKSVRLVNPVGAPFAVTGDDSAKPWNARFVARPVEGGNVELASTLRVQGKVIGEPVIVVKPGESGSVEIGDPGQPARFHLEARLTLHDADWTPDPNAAR